MTLDVFFFDKATMNLSSFKYMSTSEQLLKNADIRQIAEQGDRIYQKIKGSFEPEQNGKFLAIDVKSENYYVADASSEAVEMARAAHPDTVFYVVKIGHFVAETLASMGFYAHGLH